MIQGAISRWLNVAPLIGWRALFCAIAVLGLPTIVRAAVLGTVTGCEFTPYLPFVLVSAILLRWWHASAVALACVAILGGLLGGSPALALSCFAPAAGIFIASSTIIIGVAVMVRRFVAVVRDRRADESEGGIIFSLEKGEVWASWYGHGLPVRLGQQARVSSMMKDFLAQEALGIDLDRRS